MITQQTAHHKRSSAIAQRKDFNGSCHLFVVPDVVAQTDEAGFELLGLEAAVSSLVEVVE